MWTHMWLVHTAKECRKQTPTFACEKLSPKCSKSCSNKKWCSQTRETIDACAKNISETFYKKVLSNMKKDNILRPL